MSGYPAPNRRVLETLLYILRYRPAASRLNLAIAIRPGFRDPAIMAEEAPRISLIWAQDKHRLIGAGNRLPWHLPADLAWFRKHTMGKPILMGRKTFESIGKPLPGRRNLILSRHDINIDGCTVVHSPNEAIETAGEAEELMVIGGEAVYAQMLPRAECMYITVVHEAFEGNVFFPTFDETNWRETLREEHEADETNPYPYTFRILERRS